jgi:DnaK suppressor protein
MERPDWMTDEWLARQRTELVEARDRLRGSIERETDLLGITGTADPREPGDVAQEDREDLEVAGTMDVTQSSFRAVEDAIARIDAGKYGRCVAHRGWIPRERLEAIPWAPRCLPCQEAFEKSRAGTPAGA